MSEKRPRFNLEHLSDYLLHKLEQEILIIRTTRAMRAEGLLPENIKKRGKGHRVKKPQCENYAEKK